MLSDKIKGILIGTLIGATLAGGVAIAANTTTLYDVITSGIKIVMDGKKLNPTDANGNSVEPLIYNGTTYLPVRAVASALDKAVYWDGPEYTVYLGDMDGKLEYPTVYLEDMDSIGDDICKTDKLTDNYENRYGSAIVNERSWGSTYYGRLEYLLNMKYSRFKGVLYIAEGTAHDGELGHLEIIADGKKIYTSPEMTKTSRPIEIDVNVKGYNDVKINFEYKGNIAGLLYLADAGFYQ